MLSPNTLLNKARYRVERFSFGSPKCNVYAAVDQNVGATVLVVEHANAEAAPMPTHEGSVIFQDSFVANGHRYDVTEPLASGQTNPSVAKTWDDLSVILMALNTISAVSGKRCEIGPQTIVATANAGYKILAIESAPAPVEIEAWHVPIERIWHDLDHISQNAIYNAWDESSLAGLERPLDESSDLYSVAATFYHIFAGITPPSAFERTVVGLDDADPLVAPQALEPELGEEAGAHLRRCLELRRERRFQSFEEAIMSLPTLSVPTPNVEEDRDLLDLGAAPQMPVPVRANAVVAKVEIAQTVKYEPTEIPENIKADVVIERMPVSHPSQQEVADTTLPTFALETDPRHRPGMKFAFAGVILAVIGGIGWGAYQLAGTGNLGTNPVTAAQIVAPVTRNEPAAIPSPTPADAGTITATKASTEVPVDTTQADASVKPDGSHPRPQVATKTAAKPATTTDPKAKKKVTVDDLINDN